jgi:hypothetical protein
MKFSLAWANIAASAIALDQMSHSDARDEKMRENNPKS